MADQKEIKVRQTVPLLVVSDIAKSRSFYCNGLGFEVTGKWEPGGELAWCWLKHGGAALMLQQACADDPPAEDRGKGVTFYFICEDATAVQQGLTQRGINASDPAIAYYGMNQTFVTDPDGYELCFENATGESEY